MSDCPPLELPFDAYQRYQLVADLVRRFPGCGPETSVLDVGGRTALMRSFLPELRVDLVDVDPAEADGLVIGSGGALPFRDDSFDIVTACDTLEHVPPQYREQFIAECARVSRGWVVLAGPYDAPEVREAESGLREFLKRKLQLDHRYLNEHSEHGLPARDRTEECFRSAGCSVQSVGHASLQRWLPLMCLEMYMDSDPQLREVAKRYFRVYNHALYSSDHAGPVYRHAVVAAQPGVALPSTDGLFERPVAPPEVTELFGELFGELVAFDRERDVYEAERDRLSAVNDGLVKDLREHELSLKTARTDLEEHQRALATTRVDLEEHARSLATARVDLSEHKETVATLRTDLREHADSLRERQRLYDLEHDARIAAERELEDHRASLEEFKQRCESQELVMRDLERDLHGNRETVDSLRKELTTFRNEHEAMVRSLQAELEAHRSLMHDQQAELQAHSEQAEKLKAELAAERAERARLETELKLSRQTAEQKVGEILQLQREQQQERERAADLESELIELRNELEDRWRCFRRAIDFKRHA